MSEDKKVDKDGPLNNNSFFRNISDELDSALGTTYDNPKDSMIRATFHGTYHAAQYLKTGNQREWERAKDQFGTGFGGSTDNLKQYDESKKQSQQEEK
jgi:hypothetical protein